MVIVANLFQICVDTSYLSPSSVYIFMLLFLPGTPQLLLNPYCKGPHLILSYWFYILYNRSLCGVTNFTVMFCYGKGKICVSACCFVLTSSRLNDNKLKYMPYIFFKLYVDLQTYHIMHKLLTCTFIGWLPST